MLNLGVLDTLYGRAEPTVTGKLDNTSYMTIITLKGKKRVETLYNDIIKGLKRGENNYILLLKALEALGTLTGDDKYYTEPKAIIIELHGRQLAKEIPLLMAMKDVKAKITMLENAQKKKSLTDNGRWLNSQSQQELRQELQELERELKNTQQGTLL